jgi:hypothetical protein
LTETVQAAPQLQRRPYKALAEALSCALCKDVVKEATLCTECLHTCKLLTKTQHPP